MSQGSIGGKGEDGDEYRSRGPEVDTQGVKVLPSLQALQLQSSKTIKKTVFKHKERSIVCASWLLYCTMVIWIGGFMVASENWTVIYHCRRTNTEKGDTHIRVH